MCVVSMVMDSFQPRFPQLPADNTITIGPIVPWSPPLPVDELRQLIQEFREAVAAARRVDVLTRQPDCEDPEKAKLEDRVAELETRVATLEREALRRRAFPASDPIDDEPVTR